MEWVAPHGPWDDLIMFVFDGGAVTPRVARELRPRDPELQSVGWYTLEQAARLLREDVWERTRHALYALEDKASVYRYRQ